MAKSRLSLLVLLALCVFWSTAVQAAEKGILPVSCQVKLDKDEIATGDRMKIWAWYFLDAERRLPKAKSRIVVFALKGEILNGMQIATEAEGIKAFQVGAGVVELIYKAPEECPDEPENILVFNSLDNLPIDMQPMDLTHRYEKIGEREIKLICPNYLMLTQTILHRTQRGNTSSLLDVKVKVRIPLEAMGGSAVATQNAEVVEYSGRDMYVSSSQRDDYSLSGATVGSLSGAVQIFRDDNGRITSIGLPPMSVLLSWRGGEGLVPPKEIVVGPVRKPSKEERKAYKKAVRKARKRVEGRPPTEMYGEIMPHLQKMLSASPDLKATDGDRVHRASGGGEIQRPEPDGVNKETFKWDLVLHKR